VLRRRPYVVASVPIRNNNDLHVALSIADADYVELRLDYHEDPLKLNYEEMKGKRIIMTLRELDEGGHRGFEPSAKKRLIDVWRSLGLLYDIELRFVEKYGVEYDGAIVSIHILNGRPSLDEVVAAVSKYMDKAFAVKVALRPFKGYKAFLASLLELGENIAVMPIGVDEVERIAFALLGSKLIYGYVTQPTALGQPHYKKLLKVLELLYVD
jgi:3-dehydroquinate dehydratase-1